MEVVIGILITLGVFLGLAFLFCSVIGFIAFCLIGAILHDAFKSYEEGRR